MGGGLMQLVAYGAQDVYLTGNPQITFFKVVYRRHTNFSVEPIPQIFNGSSDYGKTVTCNLNRNGDLITNIYVVIKLGISEGPVHGYVRRLGFALIKETKIEIGGSKIDEQYGDWLNIWYELSHKNGQEKGIQKMIGDVSELTKFDNRHPAYTLHVPLQFWFNKYTGLALPLIALQYHDVRITIQYRKANECVNIQNAIYKPTIFYIDDSYLLIDYVYLDSEERKRFAQSSHEYLIEQLQFTGSEALTTVNNKYKLNFNHPSKYLIWTCQLDKYVSGKKFLSYPSDGNWNNGRDNFAKYAWLSSRSDYSLLLDSVESDVTELSINPNLAGTKLYEIVTNRIKAQYIVLPQNILNSGDNLDALLPSNVILLTNEVTSEDLSYTLDELLENAPAATYNNVTSFVNSTIPFTLVYDWFNYSRNIDGNKNCVSSAKLQLNGHDRFQEREGSYFNYVQPYQHFTNTPSDGINVYSFALKPEEHQPSGSCNFSRIDNATLNITCAGLDVSTSNNSIVNIYTVNYNVLRVMSGMAGTAYSN